MQHTCKTPQGDLHGHKCDKCGTVFQRSEASRNCDACHTCPVCGATDQFVIHKPIKPASELEKTFADLLFKP